jgi:hypothetical protein
MRLKSSDHVFALQWSASKTDFSAIAPRKDGNPNWSVIHQEMNKRYLLVLDAIAHRDERRQRSADQGDLFKEASK